MGIIYRKGDILEAFANKEIDILAHGCNCSGGFGSGVAGQIARKYSLVKQEYLKAYQKSLCVLGWVQRVSINNQIIANCMTQQEYGRNKKTKYVSYEAIRKCMGLLKKDHSHLRIGIPKIGAGLANGNWEIIEKDISTLFDRQDIFVYVL